MIGGKVFNLSTRDNVGKVLQLVYRALEKFEQVTLCALERAMIILLDVVRISTTNGGDFKMVLANITSLNTSYVQVVDKMTGNSVFRSKVTCTLERSNEFTTKLGLQLITNFASSVASSAVIKKKGSTIDDTSSHGKYIVLSCSI